MYRRQVLELALYDFFYSFHALTSINAAHTGRQLESAIETRATWPHGRLKFIRWNPIGLVYLLFNLYVSGANPVVICVSRITIMSQVGARS